MMGDENQIPTRKEWVKKTSTDDAMPIHTCHFTFHFFTFFTTRFYLQQYTWLLLFIHVYLYNLTQTVTLLRLRKKESWSWFVLFFRLTSNFVHTWSHIKNILCINLQINDQFKIKPYNFYFHFMRHAAVQ